MGEIMGNNEQRVEGKGNHKCNLESKPHIKSEEMNSTDNNIWVCNSTNGEISLPKQDILQ